MSSDQNQNNTPTENSDTPPRGKPPTMSTDINIPVDTSLSILPKDKDENIEREAKDVGSIQENTPIEKTSIVNRIISLSRPSKKSVQNSHDNTQGAIINLEDIGMDSSLMGGKRSEELRTAEIEQKMPEKDGEQEEGTNRVLEVQFHNHENPTGPLDLDEEDMGELEEDIIKIRAIRNDPHTLLPEEHDAQKDKTKKDKVSLKTKDKSGKKIMISEQLQNYLVVSILTASLSVLFIHYLAIRPLQSKIFDLETRISYRPPVMVMDLPSLVQSVPEGENFDKDVEARLVRLRSEVDRLKDAGILILDSSAVMGLPENYIYKFRE